MAKYWDVRAEITAIAENPSPEGEGRLMEIIRSEDQYEEEVLTGVAPPEEMNKSLAIQVIARVFNQAHKEEILALVNRRKENGTRRHSPHLVSIAHHVLESC